MIYRITVEITTPLYATEVKERVVEAITNLFPEAAVEERHGELTAQVHTLDHFSDQLRSQGIVDTARDVFLSNRAEGSFQFELKKQAAYQDVINFAVGSPDELGEIHVWVGVEEPSVTEFIEFIAPHTEPEE